VGSSGLRATNGDAVAIPPNKIAISKLEVKVFILAVLWIVGEQLYLNVTAWRTIQKPANPPTREQLPFYASGVADVRATPSTWTKASIALLTNLQVIPP